MTQEQTVIAKRADELFAELQANLEKSIEGSTFLLGSCQYDTAAYLADFALKFLKLDRDLFERTFGITYETAHYKETDFLPELQAIIAQAWKDDEDKDPDDEEPTITSVADYYDWCRDNAGDLWSAATIPLAGFEIPDDKRISLPTFGPIFNQMAQEENFMVGLAIAYTQFFFDTPLSVFSDFDT